MKRIDTSTRAINLFGAGKDGFKDGNLALGVAPTNFNALWANMVQEEIANVVEGAGITLDGALRNQLLSAIAALTTQRFTGTNQLLNPNGGYQKLPGGLILQWGLGGLAAGAGTGTFSFPIAFPNACLRGVINDLGSTVFTYAIASPSASTYTVWRSNTAGGAAYQFIAVGY